MNLSEKWRDFAACVEIVHHIPGRIRLRLAQDEPAAHGLPLQSLLGQAEDFRQALERVPAVRSVRVNLLARSCTIEYDPRAMPAQAWVDFLANADSPAANALRQAIVEKCMEVAGG